ncbi:MAG: hypothetical protein HQK53_16565 [Oligoflexia bacterium]|nr:hypothetical protein [Oligoflexia bacterium]
MKLFIILLIFSIIDAFCSEATIYSITELTDFNAIVNKYNSPSQLCDNISDDLPLEKTLSMKATCVPSAGRINIPFPNEDGDIIRAITTNAGIAGHLKKLKKGGTSCKNFFAYAPRPANNRNDIDCDIMVGAGGSFRIFIYNTFKDDNSLRPRDQ